MSGVQECKNHGFFTGDSCPECNLKGELVLDESEKLSLSKFMCMVLRHNPEEFGISLDSNGWAYAYELVKVCDSEIGGISPKDVASVVAVDPKGRFEVDGDKIRAAYGHSDSLDIKLCTNDFPVPDTLYHGTAPDNISSIMEYGLQPKSRKLVHLTNSKKEALDVGSRHSENPELLLIDSESMIQDGLRVTKRGNSVYTTEEVPPQYIRIKE